MYVLSPRLQGLLQSVYGERSRLRKHMADLDATERETLLRIYRKVRRHDDLVSIPKEDGQG